MVGNSPFAKGEDGDGNGGTTWIGAPIVPVNVDLRNLTFTALFLGKRLSLTARNTWRRS